MIKAAERERKNAMRAVAWLRKRRERSLQANKQMRDAADNALRTLMTPERRNARIDKAEREVQAAARFQCKMLREYKSFAGPRGWMRSRRKMDKGVKPQPVEDGRKRPIGPRIHSPKRTNKSLPRSASASV